MKILYTNINGLINKIVEVKNVIKIYSFNTIGFTETH